MLVVRSKNKIEQCESNFLSSNVCKHSIILTMLNYAFKGIEQPLVSFRIMHAVCGSLP